MRKVQADYILTKMLEAHGEVSDLNFTVDKPLQIEADGELIPVGFNPSIEKLTPFQTEVLALNLINNDRRLLQTLVREGSCDSSYYLPGKARFRVNVFSQKSYYSIAMRKLSTYVPSISELNLPSVFYNISDERNGIIMVTGATGTGKSTSLAAMLDEMNEKRAIHVITLEDPIEFVHNQKKATFNQRELGTDFDTFANGLRAALRQAPKVIFVGEMRDRETVEIGLSAAETGHLVLSTIHTVDAGQTINRILGMFEVEEEREIRIRLADTLRWVVGQRLLPKEEGGRVAAFEILGNNLRTKELILNGESEEKTYYNIMTASEPFGMLTFDKCIIDLYKEGKITEETALSYSSRRSVVNRGIDSIKSERGVKTTDIEDLTIDNGYDRIDK
jgi:twitching motility protein PilT